MKTLINIFLSFMLSLTLVGLSLIIVIGLSCFRITSIYDDLSASNYYENVQAGIYDKAEAITLPTGLALDVLKDTVALDAVERDVKGYVRASFQGKTYQADTTGLRSKLEQNVNGYLMSVGIQPDKDQKANIVTYLQLVTDEYNNSIKIPLLDYLISARNVYQKILYVGIFICSAVMGVIVFLMLSMNGWRQGTLEYLTYSTLATAMMLAAAPAFVLLSGFYRRLRLSPEYFYQFTMTYITRLFEVLLYTGLYFGVISIILMLNVKSTKLKLSKKYEKVKG